MARVATPLGCLYMSNARLKCCPCGKNRSINWIRQGNPTHKTFNVSISGLRTMQTEISPAKQEVDQIQTKLFNKQLARHAKEKNTNKILHVYEGMKAKKVPMDANTFNTLLEYFTSQDKLQYVLNLFEEMLIHEVLPNARSINVMIDYLNKRNDIFRLRRFLQLLRQSDIKPNDFTYNTVIHCFGRLGTFEELEEWYEASKQENVTLNTNSSCLLLKRYFEHDQNKGWAVFEELQQSKPFVVEYCNVVLQHVAKNDRNAITEVFTWIKNQGTPDIVTFNTMISAHLDDYEMVKMIHKELLQNVQPDEITENLMIRAIGKAGHVTEMLERYQKFKDEGRIPSNQLFRTIFNILVNKDPYKAFELFKDTEKYSNLKLNLVYQTDLLNAAIKKREDKLVVGVFNSIQEPTTGIFMKLIEYFGNRGDLIEVMKYYLLMKERSPTPPMSVYTKVILICGQLHGVKEIIRLWDDFKQHNQEPDLVMWFAIITALGRARRPMMMMKMYDVMKKRDVIPDRKMLDTMVRLLPNNDKYKAARQKLSEEWYWITKETEEPTNVPEDETNTPVQ